MHVSKFGFNGGYLFDSYVNNSDEFLYFLTKIEDGICEYYQLEYSDVPKDVIVLHEESDIIKKINSVRLSVSQVDSIVIHAEQYT